MKYYAYIINDVLNKCGIAPLIADGLINVEIPEYIFNNIDEYMWDKTNQVIILNPHYEEEQVQKREENFNRQFFNTSLGYIRRKFTNKNGEVKEITYGDVKKQIELFANNFQKTIADKSKYVGLLLENSPEWVSSYYGLLMAGYVPVLLSTAATKEENGKTVLCL